MPRIRQSLFPPIQEAFAPEVLTMRNFMKELDRPLRAVAAFAMCASMIVGMMVIIPGGSEAWSNDAQFVGFVKDSVGTPLPNTYIKVMLFAGNGVDIGYSFTDGSGHYSVGVPGGQTYEIFAANSSYYMPIQSASVLAGATTWVNFTLESISPAVPDVTIKGFVKDSLGNPATGGHILGIAMDPSGSDTPYYANLTTPDVTGYYEVRILESVGGGGVVALDYAGFGMIQNMTHGPTANGETYWLNITLGTTSQGEDAVLQGTVTDKTTGLPIENVMVSAELDNMWTHFSNMTFTDPSGNYRMDVLNGSARVTFTRLGYTMQQNDSVTVLPGSTVTIDAVLMQTDARVKGNVTDLSTGAPVANARVFLFNATNMAIFSMAVTNGSGFYDLYAFSGSDLIIGAEQDGYGRNISLLSLAPGELIWMDFGIWPVDSWIVGHVADYFTAAPISNAWVNAHSSTYDAWGNTDPSGDYNISVVHGTYSVDIGAMNYRENFSNVDAVAHTAVAHDVDLLPWDLPMTVMVWGYVNDSISGAGISNAQVRLAISDMSYQNQTWTNGTGYYSIMAPPMELLYRFSASQHADEFGLMNLTALSGYRLDITLERDTTSPAIVYDQAPVDYISWSRPSVINATVTEDHISQIGLSQLMYMGPATGGNSKFRVLTWDWASFDPWYKSSQTLNYTSPAPGTYKVDTVWNGTVPGGWIGNATHNEYVGVMLFSPGSDVGGISGNYSNATVTVPQPGTLVLNITSGELLAFVFSDSWMYPTVMFPDATGVFTPIAMVLEANMTSPAGWWSHNEELGTWNPPDLEFVSESLVPSGDYMTMFYANDMGNNGNGMLTHVTVDNDVPVADAGTSQTIVEDTEVHLSAFASHDSMGIENYTWTIDDQGTIIATLWGEAVDYTLSLGNYTVNLTVTDNGGHSNSASATVTAVHDLPPTAAAGADFSVDEDTVADFNSSGSSDDVGIVNYTWTIQELSVDLWGAAPTFNFATPGVYHVELVVRDTIGQSSMPDEVIVTVNDLTAPVANAGSNMTVSFGHAASLDGSLSTDNLAVTNWTWNFTDMGAHAVYGQHATHSFSGTGTYLVTLTVKDAAGHSATDTIVVTVVDDTAPVANAGPDQTVEVGEEVSFDASSSADEVGIVNYTWTIRNNVGVVGTVWGQLPKHTFTTAGTFNVTLDCSDAAGNHGTDVVKITVNVLDTQDPVAHAGLDVDVKAGAAVTFDGSGSTDNAGVVNYTWTFVYGGETKKVYTAAPSFTFDKAGDYTVTLEVRDAAGNTATDTVLVHVADKTGSSTMMYVGAGVAAVAAILVALAMLMRKRGGTGKKGAVEGADELEEELEMPEPPAKEEL